MSARLAGASAAAGAVAGAGAVGAAYWRFMSPWSQALGPFPYRAATDEPVVALTFDDGPNEPFTSQIADTLADRGVRATFFQVGACVERHPGVTERLVADGHLIGNHSYSHQFRRCLDDTAMRSEIARTQSILAAAVGRMPHLYRPPWLLRTPGLFETLRELGLAPVSGEFCHELEPFQPSAQAIARRALTKVRPGAMLIFHDGFDGRGGNRASTAKAVELVVDALIDRGYRFATVEELLAGRPVAGVAKVEPGGSATGR